MRHDSFADRVVSPVGLDLQERVVEINRVAKVVKGGRRFSFTALVVVGDEQSVVGIGYGKANEVPIAIQKGVERAKKNLYRVPKHGSTITHPVDRRLRLRPRAAQAGLARYGRHRRRRRARGAGARGHPRHPRASRWAPRTRSTSSRRRWPASRTCARRRRSREIRGLSIAEVLGLSNETPAGRRDARGRPAAEGEPAADEGAVAVATEEAPAEEAEAEPAEEAAE